MNTIQFGKLTILPESGRVLKLEPVPGCNVFWNNPLPKQKNGWHNPGGDRTWISPECELFLPDGTWKSYTVPAAVDPGRYDVLEHSERHVCLRNRIAARFFRRNTTVSLTLTKNITETTPVLPDVDAAVGYETETRLQAEAPLPAGVTPAVWNLLQLPPGGKIFFTGAVPVSYFGRPDWRDDGKGLRSVEIPAAGESYKIGIPAREAQSVMAYLNTSAEHPFLVARRFNVNPAGHYCDVPLGRPNQPCVQQFFSDNGEAGGFGEMEYHTEALTPERLEVVDRCSTFACLARREILELILKQLFR